MPEQLRFGVELEVALEPREVTLELLQECYAYELTVENPEGPLAKHAADVQNNRLAIMFFLRDFIAQQGILVNNPVDEQNGRIRDDIDYTKWSVIQDASIQTTHPVYGVELVSPIFISDVGPWNFDCTGTWQRDIQMVWSCLEKYFHIVTVYNHSCGTHVHVSPLGGYTTEQVKNMCRYLVRSHQRITRGLPKDRQNLPYTRPNFTVRPAPDLDTLASDLSVKDLVDMMMPRKQDIDREKLGKSKYVAWNFLPLLKAKGTIEYRQPPHVNEFWEVQYWIQWTLSLFFRGLHFKQ